MNDNKIYDVVIIGAGPCGLSCAIEAKKEGLDYIVLEKGSIAESIRRYPINMQFFSTSEMIEIGNIPFISKDIRPTRAEALKYYRKVAEHYELNISRFTNVEGIASEGGQFTLHTTKGPIVTLKVIVSIGYYDVPRALHIDGESLSHVTHYYDEPYRYAHAKCIVVGGANSAIETALDLYRNGAEVTMVHQFESLDKTAKYWIVPDLENRIKKGDVQAYFKHCVIKIDEKQVHIKDEHEEVKTLDADFVFLMVGYRPDKDLLEKIGIQLNGEAFIPTIDEKTFESNIAGIYMAGSVIGGEETAKVFIENGRLHAGPVVADIKSKIQQLK